MNVWDRVKQVLAVRLSPESYENWIAKTRFVRLSNDRLSVDVPNMATKVWLEQEYQERVKEALREAGLSVAVIDYEITAPDSPADPAGALVPSTEPLVFAASETRLNPKFTFETFVVGSSNQFAHAAARAVATMGSKTYNPLFIYGGVGIGKTHLMHAIGRALLDNFGAMRIVYTSSERFMNEMIACIKLDRISRFHQYYRSADVLLIDDIHVLGGKERTQEELFHTFNELYDHQKQIVISSDSAPKQIPGLVERLRSRFEWGLMVDIQPPDLETKMAILDKKAEAHGVALPDDIRIFIATRVKTNVRELEGALVKLIAFASVTGEPMSLNMAQHVLKHLGTNGTERRISIESVARTVAEHFNLQLPQLKQRTNAHHITFPRQIAMFLAKELTRASLPEIGRWFGGKHHTTVLHSIQKIERLRQADNELNRLIHSLVDTIH
jgi:chromosomal replication initiator protein